MRAGNREKTDRKRRTKGKAGWIKRMILTVVLIAAAFMVWLSFSGEEDNEEKTTVITSSQLEEVLQISELSTYKVTFNGVASVTDDRDRLLYHVAYEARVDIGLNMEKIRVEVDDREEEEKRLIVVLPEIEITDVNVDAGSLDYIFKDRHADTDDVSLTALSVCKADAEEECGSNDLLFSLAEENAVNTIRALAEPLLEQQEGYTLVITDKGGTAYE